MIDVSIDQYSIITPIHIFQLRGIITRIRIYLFLYLYEHYNIIIVQLLPCAIFKEKKNLKQRYDNHEENFNYFKVKTNIIVSIISINTSIIVHIHAYFFVSLLY